MSKTLFIFATVILISTLLSACNNSNTPNEQDPLKGLVAAISVGIYQDEVLLDLCYEEDSSCQTDLNVVMTQAGEFIEIQGTAEEKPFTREQSNAMLEMAEKGIAELVKKQQEALGW